MKALLTFGVILALLQVTEARALLQKEALTGEQILRRAVALHQAGDMKGAIRQYEAFLALYPNVADVRFNLGVAYTGIGNYKQAIAEYEHALKLGGLTDPKTLRSNLGWAYFKAADFVKSEKVLTALVAELPKDENAALLLASCYLRRNDARKVIELLTPFESEMGEDPQFAYLLGSALIQEGQIEKGERLAKILLKEGDSAEARMMLGTARLRAGDFFRAAEEYKRAVELNPKLPAVNAAHGNVLRELQRPDEADESYRRELEINPNDFDSNFHHGIYLYKFEQKYEEALAYLQRALRSRPGHLDVRYQIGLIYIATNRTEEALKIIKQVVEESPNSLEAHSTLTQLYYRMNMRGNAERHSAIVERLRKDQAGQKFIQQGRFSEAVKLFNQLKRADPSDPRPYFFAGMALSQMKDWTAAAAELKEAVRLDPENPKYLVTHANALARSGQYQLAIEKLGPIKPEWVAGLTPEVMLLLSETYYLARRPDEALQVLDVMARRDPNSARINLLRGKIYLGKRDYQRARQFVEMSIKRLPKHDAAAYFILGEARYQLGDSAGAREAYLQAVSQDPDNAEYIWKLGAVCLALGNSQEAVTYLEQAKPAADEFPEIYSVLGKAYEAENNTFKARESLEQYEALKKKQ